MHLVNEVISVNGDVTLAHDHVLHERVHALMHLVHEVLSVNGDVTFAPDLVLHLVHENLGSKVMLTSPQIMYLTIKLMSSCTQFMEVTVSMVMLHSPQIMYLTREIMTSCTCS